MLVLCQRAPSLPVREALPPDIAARWEEELAYVERIRNASIYPAVQRILLACCGLGARYVDHNEPPAVRGRSQSRARHPRGRDDLGPDADRLAD